MTTPRVTEILKNFTNYDQVPKNILDKAATRGTAVHTLCAGIAKGAWIPDGMIDEELLPYVNSFKKWSKAQVKDFVIVEKRYSHKDLNYNGQLDFVVTGTDGETYLVDLKTSARPQKTYPLQMAAYNELLLNHGIKVKGAMLVYLPKTGEFPNIDYIEKFEDHFYTFKCALACWKYFNKGKKNDKDT